MRTAAAATAATSFAWRVSLSQGTRSRAPAFLGSAVCSSWSAAAAAAAPSSVKGKQRQQRTWYSNIASQPLSSTEVAHESESSKTAQLRAAETAQLLEQVRAAHIDGDAAITAYTRLRRDPESGLHELSDIKLERLCEAIVSAHAHVPAGMMVLDLRGSDGSFRAAPGSWRRLKALQILLGKGFSEDGKTHVLGKIKLLKALRFASVDSRSLGATLEQHTTTSDSSSAFDVAVLRYVKVQHALAFLRQCCHDPELPARDFAIALLHHLRTSDNHKLSSKDRLNAFELAKLSHHIYFRSSIGAGDPQTCSDMVYHFQKAAQICKDDLSVAREFAKRWRDTAIPKRAALPWSPLLEVAALCIRAYIKAGWCKSALYVVKQLHVRLSDSETGLRADASLQAGGNPVALLPADLLQEVLYAIGADPDLRDRGEGASLLISAFQMFESTLLPYIYSNRILSLTGLVQSQAMVAKSRVRAIPVRGSDGRVEVAQLLETALRSRQGATLEGPASHGALIKAILTSPVFPVLFIHLVRLRRGDLAGSLLELLQLVPPLPARSRAQGSLAALSSNTALSWVGHTESVIPTDRPVLIQAAAQAKLRWHSAFLYHRWAEDQLRQDNAMIFERMGGLGGGGGRIGDFAPPLREAVPATSTSRIGMPMAMAQQAVQRGLPVHSNAVTDSATCTWNMVKLFATSDVAPQSVTAVDTATTRDSLTEAEFARLIFSTFMALNSGRPLKAKDTTTMAAAAFSLNDTATALSLLSSKLQTGSVPDIVDIGVVLAGFANNNVELAVKTFLDKLNNVQPTTAADATAEILERLEPAPELYSMLISKCVFRGRKDLVSQLLEDADRRGLMSTAVVRSLDVILRQNIDLRPQQFLHLLEQLTYADDWTPDPRILAWFCRCAARGQSLKEAMERAQAHAEANSDDPGHSDEDEGSLRTRQRGNVSDLTAAVGIFGLSARKLGYIHGPTALLLVKALANVDDPDSDQRTLSKLLDQVAQMVFHADRIDAGAQQRMMEGTKWDKLKGHNAPSGTEQGDAVDNRNTSPGRRSSSVVADTLRSLPPSFFDDLVRAYVTLYDFKGASEIVLWTERAGIGRPTLSDTTRRVLQRRARSHEKGTKAVLDALEGKGRVTMGRLFWEPPSGKRGRKSSGDASSEG
ncbi:hypothetical protein A4X13_0g5288 [Tilletia indica]|uniref:Uncharacterized protein n=1 Tax=Tilletia indica TaxID=43049 RepID=A0A177TQK9_9BASI|nr:hypothetical protein A4X13_0g5288 [Tilletia indica]